MGRTSHSPSNSGQYLRCRSMNSVVSLRISALESAWRIAHPPMISLLSMKGPSVVVSLPLSSRIRKPSRLGARPPVSTRAPAFVNFSISWPMASIMAAGGCTSRYFSELRTKLRYFMFSSGWGFDRATNEPRPDRHAPVSFFGGPGALLPSCS